MGARNSNRPARARLSPERICRQQDAVAVAMLPFAKPGAAPLSILAGRSMFPL